MFCRLVVLIAIVLLCNYGATQNLQRNNVSTFNAVMGKTYHEEHCELDVTMILNRESEEKTKRLETKAKHSGNNHFTTDLEQTLTVTRLQGSKNCNDTGIWFYSKLEKRKSSDSSENDSDAALRSNKQVQMALSQVDSEKRKTILTKGEVRCDGYACIPPFWAWWDEIRGHCTLEWIGARAQRDTDRAPWESGAIWDSTLAALRIQVEDTYMRRASDDRIYVWHCKAYPRLYTSVSIECPAPDNFKYMWSAPSLAYINEETNVVHTISYTQVGTECYLNVRVGLAVHILLYGFSTVILIGFCSVYLICLYVCVRWCNTNCPCCCPSWIAALFYHQKTTDNDDDEEDDIENGTSKTRRFKKPANYHNTHHDTRTRTTHYRGANNNNAAKPATSLEKRDEISGKKSDFNLVYSMLSRPSALINPGAVR